LRNAHDKLHKVLLFQVRIADAEVRLCRSRFSEIGDLKALQRDRATPIYRDSGESRNRGALNRAPYRMTITIYSHTRVAFKERSTNQGRRMRPTV
jgi:hypothetical protein